MVNNLYTHHTLFTGAWRWPNFSPRELSCNHCGEYYHDPASLDLLQKFRALLGRPISPNSAHRCPYWNLMVGGTPLSQHKKIAFDIPITSSNRIEVLKLLKQAGFSTFGFYNSFIHTDIRPNRTWYGSKEAKQIWIHS